MHYNKQPLTYQQQLDLLISRGLVVADTQKALKYMQQISYYRLSAYFLPFQQTKDRFNLGTTFENILDLYRFDKELRMVVFDVIERVEVAIRSQMVNQLSLKYNDSHWQDNDKLFKPPLLDANGGVIADIWDDTIRIIDKHCQAKHPEVYIKHYLDKYETPYSPPSWMCMELLTIGELSRLYSALANNADRKDIADYFGLHHTVFTPWLHTITYVRNICAHHGRLWNREFAIKPDILLKPRFPWMRSSFENNNDRCFYFLCTLKYMLHAANPSNHFRNKLSYLFAKYPTVPVQYMGIPTDRATGRMINWLQEPLWQ